MSELLAGADISGLPQRGKVVVGFSGGADSTALAHWLLGLLGPERLVLAHVNHQLRGEESDRDEAAARAFAQRFGLDFALRREDVAALARRRGVGVEVCGRRVRAGRRDRGEREALMDSRPVRWVGDATHPYAAQATENIRAAARAGRQLQPGLRGPPA